MTNVIASNLPPDLNVLIQSAIRQALKDCNVAKPGKIVSFNTSLQTATIELMIKATLPNGSIIDFPPLVDVPVFVLSGGNGFINVPVASGDDCFVIFADRDIDNWYYTGSSSTINLVGTHDLKDGFAIVGFRPQPNAISGYDDSLAFRRQEAKLGISASQKILFENSQMNLLQLLTSLVQALLQMQIVTPGQPFILPNTPGMIDNPTQILLQQFLQDAIKLIE
jgi:hypothetical protein